MIVIFVTIIIIIIIIITTIVFIIIIIIIVIIDSLDYCICIALIQFLLLFYFLSYSALYFLFDSI